ncbi:MAG: glycosyltransferase family 4 protein [Thermodesulfobacteriota bacterium]
MNSKKKLVVILPRILEEFSGGAELQTSYLIKSAVSKGIDVHYIFLSTCPNTKSEKNDAKLAPLPGRDLFLKLGNITYPYFIRVQEALANIKPDIIYNRTGTALTGAAAYYAKNNNCRLIFHIASDIDVTLRMLPWNKPWLIPEDMITQYGIRNADIIIAQTNFQVSELMRNYNRKGIIIPNGHPIPPDFVKSEELITVLWIANWKHVKKPELFVRLVEEIGQQSNVRFLMIGRTGGYDDLVKKAKNNNIEVMGEIPNERVNEILNQSHILVNTSQTEGFSNTFIQAWLRRVPVVSLKVDPDKIIQNKQLGLCSGDFSNFIQNTRKLIEDHNLRNTMGSKARKYATMQHSLGNIDKLLKVML